MAVRERGVVNDCEGVRDLKKKKIDWVRMEECKKETHVRFNLSWHLFF
jgi:hypothetical protein